MMGGPIKVIPGSNIYEYLRIFKMVENQFYGTFKSGIAEVDY